MDYEDTAFRNESDYGNLFADIPEQVGSAPVEPNNFFLLISPSPPFLLSSLMMQKKEKERQFASIKTDEEVEKAR